MPIGAGSGGEFIPQLEKLVNEYNALLDSIFSQKILLWPLLMLIMGISIVLSVNRLNAAGFDCASVTQIPLQECLALKSLYNQTDGPNWTKNTGWLSHSNPCTNWDGIACLGGHVAVLALRNNQLNGPLAIELGDLTNLWSLNLRGNSLQGRLPSELGNLSKLSTLDLGENQLHGPLPPEFAGLTELQTLDVSDHLLTGLLPQGLINLTKIHTFWFDNTCLTAPANEVMQSWLAGINNLQESQGCDAVYLPIVISN